jgi:hypothetical protein
MLILPYRKSDQFTLIDRLTKIVMMSLFIDDSFWLFLSPEIA